MNSRLFMLAEIKNTFLCTILFSLLLRPSFKINFIELELYSFNLHLRYFSLSHWYQRWLFYEIGAAVWQKMTKFAAKARHLRALRD